MEVFPGCAAKLSSADDSNPNQHFHSLIRIPMTASYLTVSFPSLGITTAPFKVSSWIVIPGAGAALCVMCPGARTAGLGGPCGRMNRKKTRQSEIAALITMRRVICRFAMAGRTKWEGERCVAKRPNGVAPGTKDGQGLS